MAYVKKTVEEIAEEVLAAHQRHRGGCLCGKSGLGESHPKHQVEMLVESGIDLERRG